MTIKQFLKAFGLTDTEFKYLTPDMKKIVAQEYLKVKNSKQNHDQVFEEIISEIN